MLLVFRRHYMKPVVDQFSDAAFAALHRHVARLPALEAFVKEASIQVDEVDQLPETAFAWPEQRKFPLHTPEHAALSYAYCKEASEVPQHVVTALETALRVYAVPSDLFAEVKVAAAPEEVAYILPQQALLPVKSAAEVEYAVQRVLEEFPKLDLESRATACANLVKQAERYGVDLHPEVKRLAGFVVSSTKIAREWVQARAHVAPDLFKQAYEQIDAALAKNPPEVNDRPAMLKLASVIGELDERSGLDRYYDRKLPDALSTVFNTTKLASGTVDLGGTAVPLASLMSLPASFWEDLGGPELANEVAPGGVVDPQALSVVVETLPLDLKIILKNQLQ
jgi:hypothetical protein